MMIHERRRIRTGQGTHHGEGVDIGTELDQELDHLVMVLFDGFVNGFRGGPLRSAI